MRKCVLHVTDHEYAKLLQLNHNALVFTKQDEGLLRGLEELVGREPVGKVRRYDECRVEPHHRLDGQPRVAEAAR